MDIVYINGLSISTLIGIYDWEREVRQVVTLDLELGTDIRKAAGTDDIQYALNYKAISDHLIEFIQNSEFLLLETMAESVANILRDEFSVAWLRLRIGKPNAVSAARDVGIIIERGIKK